MKNKRLSLLLPRGIGIFFGSLWAAIATVGLPRLWQPFAIAGAFLVGLVLLIRLWLHPLPDTPSEASLFKRSAYQTAVTFEAAGIMAASILLQRLHLQDYLPSVVGLIVGLHFIGLWKATGRRSFITITVAMCLISTASIFLPQHWHTLAFALCF